jgi:glycosyltransferase involved in cell wall biosynthesis
MNTGPHVAIDLRIADAPGMERTGLGRYALEIARALVVARPGWRFTLFSNRPGLLPASNAVEVVTTRWPTGRSAGRVAWLNAAATREGRRRRVDVWFGPAFVLPARWQGPAVVTVHDLVFALAPRLYRGRLNARHATWATQRAVRRADAILCGSETNRQRVVRRFGAARERVHAIPYGVGEPFIANGAPIAPTDPYLLFVGTFEARKGLDTLGGAVARLSRHRAPKRLILAGRPGWRTEHSVRQLIETGLVEIVDEPSDSQLAALYRGAVALVYPSRMEGFGLPVAEAMSSGCPVIASDLPEIRDWAGDAPRYVPVGDDAALAAAINDLLERPDEAERRRVLGRKIAAGLRWPVVAERTAALLEKAAARPTPRVRRVPEARPLAQ